MSRAQELLEGIDKPIKVGTTISGVNAKGEEINFKVVSISLLNTPIGKFPDDSPYDLNIKIKGTVTKEGKKIKIDKAYFLSGWNRAISNLDPVQIK